MQGAGRKPRDAAWAELTRLWRGLDPQGRKMVLWFAQEMARQLPLADQEPPASPTQPEPGGLPPLQGKRRPKKT